jgi:hypothetical protein
MIGKRSVLVLLLLVMASACSNTPPGQSAKSLPDNPENRAVLAKQYLEIMKPKDMLLSVANRVVPQLPEKDRKPFTDIMNSPDIEKSAYRITLDGLVKHFTVGELNAMLAFYGSPDGQSAAKKYGAYLGDIMPQIQGEVKKALGEAQKQAEPQKPGEPQKKPELQKQAIPAPQPGPAAPKGPTEVPAKK